MGYLVALPSLLCGLAISVEDIRCRRVPRLWVAVGCLLQLVALIVAALLGNDLFLVLQAALFAVLCAAVQCGLALVRPGALGFGDVTVTLVMGLAVGTAGLWGVVVWWLAMGVLGLGWLAERCATVRLAGGHPLCGQGAVRAGDRGGRGRGAGSMRIREYV